MKYLATAAALWIATAASAWAQDAGISIRAEGPTGTLSGVMLGRIVHDAHCVQMKGESMQKRMRAHDADCA